MSDASPSMPDSGLERFLLMSCSPRRNGNCDAAASLFAGGYAEVTRQAPSPVFLRDFQVLPCVACNSCGRMAEGLATSGALLAPEDLVGVGGVMRGGRPPFGCPLTLGDGSSILLRALALAPALCLVAPVYFYHLPAHFKALLDRLQTFWNLREMNIPIFSGKERVCRVILLGARSRGGRLFEGSLLTLKYALEPLHIKLAEPLQLYGLEGHTDLMGDPGAREAVVDYGREAGRESPEEA